MTDPTTAGAVAVTQADREAAAHEREQDYASRGVGVQTLETPFEMRQGHRDWDPLVQKHARHRLAATAEPGGEEQPLGPHAAVFEDSDEDGFMPVSALLGGVVYIAQGGAQITMSREVAARVAAVIAPAPAAPPAEVERLREMLLEAYRAGYKDGDDGDYNPDVAMARINLAALPEAPARCEGEGLREAVENAILWHEAADKALSKQPPTADGRWRRMEHQEQAAALRAALRPATDAGGASNG